MYLNKIDVSDAIYGRDYLALTTHYVDWVVVTCLSCSDWVVVTCLSCNWFDANTDTFRPDEIVELYELPKGEQQ